MRLFTAIDIPAEVRSRLDSFLATLRPLAKLSWSPVANLHVTTRFIGDWPEARLHEMKEALSHVPRRGTFEIQVRGLGWFPNQKAPRVFWAGIEGGAPLHSLAEATSQALTRLGIVADDRPYSPHLTLARVRETSSLVALQTALQGLDANFGSFRAGAFHLYLSAAQKYTQLERFSLE